MILAKDISACWICGHPYDIHDGEDCTGCPGHLCMHHDDKEEVA